MRPQMNLVTPIPVNSFSFFFCFKEIKKHLYSLYSSGYKCLHHSSHVPRARDLCLIPAAIPTYCSLSTDFLLY